MNTVFTKIAGQGEPLLVLHGWGMNHKVWSSVQAELEDSFEVTWVDLPGHGGSKGCPLGDLDEVVDLISSQIGSLINQPAHVLGWSLGGLIAQRLAQRYPAQVRSLLLVATSPSFIKRKDWENALPARVLKDFITNLNNDYTATMQRFFSLQFLGVNRGSRQASMKSLIKLLKDEMFKVAPDKLALEAGLAILNTTDLRGVDVDCPRYWVLGRLDKLVPASVAEDLLTEKKYDSVLVIEDAGHAPFISHPHQFVNHVRESLSDDVGWNSSDNSDLPGNKDD